MQNPLNPSGHQIFISLVSLCVCLCLSMNVCLSLYASFVCLLILYFLMLVVSYFLISVHSFVYLHFRTIVSTKWFFCVFHREKRMRLDLTISQSVTISKMKILIKSDPKHQILLSKTIVVCLKNKNLKRIFRFIDKQNYLNLITKGKLTFLNPLFNFMAFPSGFP
jgi:hypothetical protein